MTDIIQYAKRLAELVDEERADLESRGAEPDEYGGFEMWLDSTVLYDNAKEVREAIKELSEETWEYAVQVKRSESWKYTYESWDNRWQGSYSVQEVRAKRDHPGEETRIVRRRVSEPEVINE